jgi:lipoate-protein ligase A
MHPALCRKTRESQMNWFLLDSGPRAAAFNMALDEALMEAVPRLGKPILRFYGWAQPAASFGYFQKFADVERATLLRPLVRRPTGGGIVPHDVDWTYSVAAPPDHDWYSLRAEESYRRMHEWIQSAFARLDVQTDLADGCRKALPGQCFAGYEKFDLLWRGRKIAGAAQRRSRSGLLIQGSVQPPPLSLKRSDWHDAMLKSAGDGSAMEWQSLESADGVFLRATTLVKAKYSQRAHNERR